MHGPGATLTQPPRGVGLSCATRVTWGPSFCSTFCLHKDSMIAFYNGITREANAGSEEASYSLESFNVFGHLKLIYKYHLDLESLIYFIKHSTTP